MRDGDGHAYEIIKVRQEVCPSAQHAQLQGFFERRAAAGLGRRAATAPAGRSRGRRAPATAATTPSAAPVPVVSHRNDTKAQIMIEGTINITPLP